MLDEELNMDSAASRSACFELISEDVADRPDWLMKFAVSGDDECATQSSILEDDVPQSRDYPIESAVAFGIFLSFCRIHDYRL